MPGNQTMWVKICGLRDLETAVETSRLGADAIGLNFYAPSPRAVSIDRAAEIVRELPGSTTPIGLFVNHPLAEVREIARQTGIKTLQLHGDEPAEYLAELTEFNLIKAFRVRGGDLALVRETLQDYARVGIRLQACLLDAYQPGQYGGTGTTIPWKDLAGELNSLPVPVILAGGLTPSNLRQAIETVQPWGVDTAGGVESAPGRKDLNLVREFIRAARLDEAGRN
ncbi:MAG: phosphoribosylanthranilate isomerase [Planctomycetales bacterium]